MDNKPYMAVVGVVVVFVLALGGAALFSGGGGGASSSGSREPVKKFRAKAGTQRENARAIISSTPDLPSENQSGGASSSTPQKPIEVWGRLDSPDEGETSRATPERARPRTASEATAQSALENPSTEEAVRDLVEALEALKDARGASELYSALGTVYARQGRLKTGEAGEAFAQAVASAETEEQRVGVYYAEAKALMQYGEAGDALETMRKLDVKALPEGRMRVELRVMEGMALENTGETEQAMKAYEEVLDDALDGENQADGEIVNVCRQAALRLSRIYRKLGRESDAKQVALRVRDLGN